jgi:putative tricarboxylic transport membrane protein
VLGGIMEQSFRQAMTISGGDLKIFYGSGITVTLLLMSVISVALPFIIPRLRALGSKGDES